MTGVLGSCSSPLLRPASHRGTTRRWTMISAELRPAPSPLSATEDEGGSSSSSSTSSPSPSSSFSPPPGLKPPKPKRFSVRRDKFLDILGASLALPFRLGTGAFVLGFANSLLTSATAIFSLFMFVMMMELVIYFLKLAPCAIDKWSLCFVVEQYGGFILAYAWMENRELPNFGTLFYYYY